MNITLLRNADLLCLVDNMQLNISATPEIIVRSAEKLMEKICWAFPQKGATT